MKRIYIIFLLTLLGMQKMVAQIDLQFNNDTEVASLTGLVTVIENAGDGHNRLFIGQRSGEVYILEGGQLSTTPFLNINPQTNGGGERGLLGMAFHPNFPTDNRVFINYTNNAGNTTIASYSVIDSNNDGKFDLANGSGNILLTIPQPAGNHNGGDLTFGSDGYLYISTGDGGGAGDPDENGQDNTSLLGCILRIDIDNGTPYGIPSDNPFVSSAGADEIYVWGLRNPWRISFDSNGDLWIADVGQNAFEEINLLKAGSISSGNSVNFGWDCNEGYDAYDDATFTGTSSPLCGSTTPYEAPVFAYAHSDDGGGASITGGFLYEGARSPGMVGYYIFAEFGDNVIYAFKKDDIYDGPNSRSIGNQPTAEKFTSAETGLTNMTTFGKAENGEIYVADFNFGTNQARIMHVRDDNTFTLPIGLTNFQGEANNQKEIELTWTTSSEVNASHFEIERSTDGKDFIYLGKVATKGTSATYQFTDDEFDQSRNYYRLKMVDLDGRFEYSKVITIYHSEIYNITLSPNPNNGRFTFSINGVKNKAQHLNVKVFDKLGKTVFTYEQQEVLFPYSKEIILPELPFGIYSLELIINDNELITKRLVID